MIDCCVVRNKGRLAGAALGAVPPPTWLQTDWILGQFGKRRSLAQAKYRYFVCAGLGLPSLWRGLQGQIFLGSPEFVAAMQARLSSEQQVDEVPRAQRRPVAKPLARYVSDQPHDRHSRQQAVKAYEGRTAVVQAVPMAGLAP